MKLNMKSARMEYYGNSWCFVEANGKKIKFDQALVNAVSVSPGRVDGYVVSVHGVLLEDTQMLDSRDRDRMGIRAVHALGKGPTLRRVRLMPDGSIQSQ